MDEYILNKNSCIKIYHNFMEGKKLGDLPLFHSIATKKNTFFNFRIALFKVHQIVASPKRLLKLFKERLIRKCNNIKSKEIYKK